MDSPPKLSGETLIVHHIPLVHCQVSGSRQAGCGGSLKRTNPFSPPENLGLSRTTSLPERDIFQTEALLYSSLLHTSSCRRGGSIVSDNHSVDQPVSAHTLPRAKPRIRNPLRHNPFLLSMEHCEDDEEEEDDADNLHGYLEDSSFHLHGDLSMEDEVPPFHLHDLGLVPEPFVLQGTLGHQWRSAGEESRESLRGLASDLANHLDDLELLGLSSQRRHGSSGSNMSVDCGEQGWGEEEEEEEDQHMRCGQSSKTGSSCSLDQRCSCCELSQNFQEHSFPGPFSECQRGYGSDSSCSSSDGVLVNFSAIYNKMNHPLSAPTNTNCSTDHSRPSSVSDPLGGQKGPAAGAFYLDLHSSPTQPLPSQQQTSVTHGNPFPVLCEPHLSTCSSSAEHQELHGLDANCNSYHALHSGSSGDLTSCLQSQARMVVATQNYYKLVTCDLSSQSSPSPVGSSITSCSDEQSKESPSPSKPSEYYLFKRQPGADVLEEEDRQERASSLRDEDKREDEEETNQQLDESEIQGQVYVNIPPPVIGRGSIGGRPRSRSYDRHLDKASPSRVGSLERMLSCPVHLSDTAAQPTTPPPRVTSFAEIARSKRRTGGVASGRADSFSSSYSAHCHASLDICPLPEQHDQDAGLRCSPMEHNMPGARETRSKAEGGDGGPLVVQRPTTLPIQPFTFQHQLAFKPPQAKPLLPLITGYVSGVQAHAVSGSRSSAGGTEEKEAEDPSENTARPPPGSVRPSPLGSYSPVRHQGAVSSGTCSTCTPSPPPACSLSFPLQTQALAKQPPTLSHPPLGLKNGSQGHCHLHGAPPSLQERHCDGLGPLGSLDSGKHPDGNKGPGCRPYNAHHLSPQALKWREYRRRNPLGLEKSSEGPGGLDPQGLQCSRRNVFDFPAAPLGHALCSHGHQSSYSDLLDYFSLTERPPEEFCLSPDDSSSSSNISVDLPHKRGLVKAVNTAVDLIVAHFGTSRDPDIKAKLGNSWVTPNVGHLILKYLCPALHEILQDGLKAYVLDLIVGQRRCHVWSLVEASTQLGPSTRVLHALFYKVSQYPELSGHSMRLNAFIFGLLNLRSLELWFNHLYTRDDIIAAHYSPWGFLPLLQGPCLALLEELLLVLQPLSLLPFDLDVLFEPHLLQKDQEHLRRKEQLCSTGHGSDQSTCSTFQLMRGWSSAVSQSLREGGDARAKEKKERAGLRREGTWPRMEGAGSFRDGWDNVVTTKGLDSRNTTMDGDVSSQWAGQGTRNQRVKSARAVSQGEREGGERDKSKERERDLDRKAGWWYQLMQSSQVYIDQSAEGSKFIKSEKRKKSSERRQLPPTREGVVEGAESCQEAEEVGKRSSVSTSREPRCSRRPSWMGSPPESVLNQEKATHGAEEAVVPATAPGQSLPQGPSLRWSRLFGSNIGSSPRTKVAEQRAKPQKSRTLSGWLALDRSVLQLKALTMAAGTGSKEESPHSPSHNNTVHPTTTAQTTATKPHSPCEVRALCQHRATEPGQLSFNKGARLKVLSRVDPDWLLCSLGFSQGLVPIVYVTLDGMEDGQ